MGSGHLMRCLTLADELQRRGAVVQFISRTHPGNLLARLEQRGYQVHRLSPPPGAVDPSAPGSWLGVDQEQDARETLAALHGSKVNLLIVDHYAIDSTWERCLQPAAARLLVIDDVADRLHEADFLLDQNYGRADIERRHRERVPERCRLLLGPRYALLQPIYKELRRVLPRRDGAVRRVLVFFGAHDPSQSAVRVLQALTEPQFAQLAIDVVPGNGPAAAAAVHAAARGLPNASIHENPQSLAGLIARADLAIGAGGTTTWERACLGLPSVVATIADNQKEVAAALAADGCVELAGAASDLTTQDWSGLIRRVLAEPERITQLQRCSLGLTDGSGAGRVARVLMDTRDTAITLRRATDADEALLLDWANDQTVRRQSFDPSHIAPETHHRWLAARLRDPDCVILIGEDAHGCPLGQVRFDAHRDRAEAIVNISVDRDARGRGAGGGLLKAAVQRWLAEEPQLRPIAEVRADNVPSQRLFLAAGFTQVAGRRPGAVAYAYRP
jgi:UDP-2,4-diacetamido-2,4,6-trideoxy-beta-L-altropyranose hydrolase